MTSDTTGRPKRRQLLITLSAIALTVAGCHKAGTTSAEGSQPVTGAPLAALPLATTAAPNMIAAPEASALPWPSQPIRVANRPRYDRYDYVDRAYGLTYAFADAPPDYTVDYDGVYPWIWRADDGAFRIVEWLPYGERDYYYEPGDAYPFYVVDPDYGYAYDDGELIGLYDLYGDPLDYGYARDRVYYATRYFDRGRDLYNAAIYRQRRSAYAEDWLARRDYLFNGRHRWEQQQARDPGWRAFRDRHAPEQFRQWRNEHNQRMTYAIASAARLGPVRDRMGREHRQDFASRGGPDFRHGEVPFWQRAGGGAFRQAAQDRGRAGQFGEQRPGQFGREQAFRVDRTNRQFATNGQPGRDRFAKQRLGQFDGERAMRFNQMRQRYANNGRPHGQFGDQRFLQQRNAEIGRQRALRFDGMRRQDQVRAEFAERAFGRRQAEFAVRQRTFQGQRWQGMRAQFDRGAQRHAETAARMPQFQQRGGLEMQHRQQAFQQQRAQMQAQHQQYFAAFSQPHGGGGGGWNHGAAAPQWHGGGGGGGGGGGHHGGGGGAPQWQVGGGGGPQGGGHHGQR